MSTSTAPSGKRLILAVTGSALLLGGLLILSPGIGTAAGTFGWENVWRAKLGYDISRDHTSTLAVVDLNGDGEISDDEHAGYVAAAKLIFDARFPRALLALQVGMTLALCGAVLQVLFRNPLATPYTLGIASGGSLGAVVAIRAGWTFAILGVSSLSLAALVGGLAVVALVYAIGRGMRRLTSNELLLAGVTVGLFCSAMMMVVTVISDERQTFAMVRWMMGSLESVKTIEGARLLPLTLPCWLLLIWLAPALNQYRLGQELAESRGVSVRALQTRAVLVATIATAAVVAQCGPIGFVGLVVPHAAGLIVGHDCRVWLPVSALLGGSFLLLCDWAALVSMKLGGSLLGLELGSAVLPTGVVTSVVGVPIFLALLWMRRR